MATTSQLDPVSVAIVAAAALFGNQAAAEIVGPYSIIIVGALLGASFGSSGSTPSTGWSNFFRFVVAAAIACIFTVPASLLIQHYTTLDARWFFAAVALLIGFRSRMIPTDMIRAIRFLIRLKSGAPQEPPK